MTPRSGPVRWAVVGGTVSPYLPELWAVVAGTGQEVVFVSERRPPREDYRHEDRRAPAPGLREIEVRGWGGWRRAMGEVERFKPDVLVTLGWARPGPLAVAARVRRCRPGTVQVVMGDANGAATREKLADAGACLRYAAKRQVVRGLFDLSFDLGWTNRLANRIVGVRRGVFMPLYSVDFATLERAAEIPLPEVQHLRRPRLACVARLVPEKNLDSLIRAWGRHCERNQSGSLFVVGSGPEERRLRGVAVGLDPERFLMRGAMDRADIGRAFGAADGFILPSRVEPWGIVVTEALGLGVPVLASDQVGAARSLHRIHPEAARLCAAEPEAILAGLSEALTGHAAWRRAAEVSVSSVRESYGMNSVAERLARWGDALRRS